ncbi:unnamed protein product [Rhizophagus irregularis]|nr:unnamed protein product [Rhizophagus irregularis]
MSFRNLLQNEMSLKRSEDGGDGLRIYEDVDHNVEGFGEPLCEMNLWGSLIFGYCNSTPRITSFLSLLIENDDVVDRMKNLETFLKKKIFFIDILEKK